MPIRLSRVDDRLIHGQVMTSWVRANDIQVIVIVDEKVSNDPLQLSVLQLSAPVGVKIYAMNQQKFLEKYSVGIFEKYNTMLIFENVFAAESLIKKEVKLNLINLGGIRFKEGRMQYTKSVFLNEDEIQSVKNIISMNVRVEHRQIQTDSSVDIKKLLI